MRRLGRGRSDVNLLASPETRLPNVNVLGKAFKEIDMFPVGPIAFQEEAVRLL